MEIKSLIESKIKLLILVTLFVFLNENTAQILTPVYPTPAQSLVRGLNPSTLTIQVGIVSACSNDTVTIRLPQGVYYIPGSVNKLSGTQTIAEANISNLRTPKFRISDVTSVGDITFTILREAACGTLSSGKDTVFVKGSCGTAIENSGITNTYNIYAPSISLVSPAPLSNMVLGSTATRTITLTNGGNGDADTVYFFMVYPNAGMQLISGTNSIIANGTTFTPFRINGDTLFYKIAGPTLFGGNNLLTNGESISITEAVLVKKCNTITSYGAGWGRKHNEICLYAMGYGNIAMAGGVSDLTSVSVVTNTYLDKCTPFDFTVTWVNGGTGNDTAGGMFDVTLNFAYVYPLTTLSPYNGNLFTISNASINGVAVSSFTNSSNIAKMNFNNLFTSDPDGAGGLADLDGDGYFDDIPRGASVSVRLTMTQKCNLACNIDKIFYPGGNIVYKTMCGTITTSTARNSGTNLHIYEAIFKGIAYIPANISGGQPFRFQFKQSFYINNGAIYDNSNTRYLWALKLPAGVSVFGSGNPTYGSSASTYWQSNDTVFIQSTNNSLQNAGLDLVYTCGTTGIITFNYILTKIQNNTTNCICQGALICASVSTLAVCPTACTQGPINYAPSVQRTDGCLGWTNSSMATRQTKSAISAFDLSKALYLDTIQVLGSAKMASAETNLHLALALTRYSNTNSLTPENIDIKIYRTGTLISAFSINSWSNNSSGNTQIVDWDLSPNLPAGGLLAGDSIYSVSRYWVSSNVTLPQYDIQTGIYYRYYSVISGTNTYCNTPVPEMYLVGTSSVDGRNGWYANGCASVSDNRSHLARRFNSNGELYANEFRPVVYIDSLVVTKPSNYVLNSVLFEGFGTLAPYRVNGNVSAYLIPATNAVIPLTVHNAYGRYFRYLLSPTCASTNNELHNVKFYIKDYYYALAGRTTYPSTYQYVGLIGSSSNIASNASGFSQAIQYNSVNSPILSSQNLTGTVVATKKQHYWDIQIANTGLSNAAYFWMALEKYTGTGITLDSVKRLSNNSILTGIPYGTANIWYQVSVAGLNSSSTETFRIFFKYSNCNTDSILFKSGWNCSAYPTPDPVTDASACNKTQQIMKVVPNPSQVQLSVARQPGNGSTISLCTQDSVRVILNSAQAADVINPYVEVFAPTGVTITNSFRVEYPLNSGSFQNLTGTAISGGYRLNLTGHTNIGANGLPGTINNSGANGRQVGVMMYYTTNCSHNSGSSFTWQVYGSQPCGVPAIGNGAVVKTDGILITGAVVSGGMGLSFTLAADTFRCSGPTKTLNLTATPILASTQIGDTVEYVLPAGMVYAGNFVPSTNCATCTATSSPGTIAGTTLVKVKLNPGISSGTSLAYKFDVGTDKTNGCGTQQISASAKRQIPPLMCGSTPCTNSSAIIGTNSDNVTIQKPNLVLTTFTGAYITGLPQFVYMYRGELSNLSGADTLKAGSNYLVEIFWDVNKNGIHDNADSLVSQVRINSAINPGSYTVFTDTFQYTNGLPPDPYRGMYSMLRTSKSPNCNCVPNQMSSLAMGLSAKLLNLKISEVACKHLLEWTVSFDNQIKPAFYRIYTKNVNGWKQIGIVNANSSQYNSTQNYKFYHNPEYGQVTYKIEEVYVSGTNTTFPIISANQTCNPDNKSITILPNPASKVVNFTVNQKTFADNFKLSILTIEGKEIFSEIYFSNSGKINIEKFAPGIYTVKLKSENLNETVKLIVQ